MLYTVSYLVVRGLKRTRVEARNFGSCVNRHGPCQRLQQEDGRVPRANLQHAIRLGEPNQRVQHRSEVLRPRVVGGFEMRACYIFIHSFDRSIYLDLTGVTTLRYTSTIDDWWTGGLVYIQRLVINEKVA